MAIVNGTDMVIMIDDGVTAGGGSPSLSSVSSATSCTLTVNIDTPEVTVKGDGDRKQHLGLSTSWTVDAEVFYNPSNAVQFESLFIPAYGDGTAAGGAGLSPTEGNYPREVYVRFKEVSGHEYEGKGVITSMSLTGGVEDAATASISILGNGSLSLT
jgi:hypothetical protein